MSSDQERTPVKFPPSLIAFVARKLRIPDLAVRMFRVAAELSGLDKSTLPVELLPLNAVQLSRGLLNFTVIQTLYGWVLPFWAEQQYDPRSTSFIPRSHLGLSMNVTHRNWTAVGNPSCTVEPIVDPRGMTTPSPNGWSIDTWLRVGNTCFFPSRADGVTQGLYDGLPIVVTSFVSCGILVRIESYTAGCRYIHRVHVTNTDDRAASGSLGLAVRPFNPEGVALVHALSAENGGRDLVINGCQYLHFDSAPSRVVLANRESGDAAWVFAGTRTRTDALTITCPFGLANALAEFFVALGPGEEWNCTAWYDLAPVGDSHIHPIDEVVAQWHADLEGSCRLIIPDSHLTDLVASSHAALLMFLDGVSVTPGPATYHYFWFRDAAYMLLALDRLGHGNRTRNVIDAYPAMQESSGMFRSQQGEWDSTGQALWSIWQHAMLTHDSEVLARLFTPMKKAVKWIDNKRENRQDDPLVAGLLPRGLSAEHLGLADVYYWDSFWSLAGLEAYARVCQHLNKPDEAARARMLASMLRADLERSISAAMHTKGIAVIPAGPWRTPDAGMIGSVAAWYPLQLFADDDPRMHSTLAMLSGEWFLQGMFYQPIVHSGLNPYLSLQIAQAFLYAGDAERFWQILRDVSQKATPTLTYPEAIHPFTGGGVMGDGHHAWAAAEVVLAIRNAFVLERWTDVNPHHTVTFLGGIPRSLFDSRKEFGITNAPVPEGSIDLVVSPGTREATITIAFHRRGFVAPGSWYVSLPGDATAVRVGGGPVMPLDPTGKRHQVAVPAESGLITCSFS